MFFFDYFWQKVATIAGVHWFISSCYLLTLMIEECECNMGEFGGLVAILVT